MKKDSQKSKKKVYLYFLAIIIVIGLVVYVNDIDIFSMIGINTSLVGGNNITLNHKTSVKIPTNVENLIDNALSKF